MPNEVTWALTLFALVCTAIFCTGTLARLAQWSVSQTLCCLVWLLRAIPWLLVHTARWLMPQLRVKAMRFARWARDASLNALCYVVAKQQKRRVNTAGSQDDPPVASQERREPEFDL